MTLHKILITATLGLIIASASAQVESGGPVRRRTPGDNKPQQNAGQVTERMQHFYEQSPTSDADLVWTRDIYRQIDLRKDANTPLYFPEDVIDGQENLFRLILNLVVSGKIPAYEYLDGREAFTDQYKVKVGETLDRFGIYYQQAKGSTPNNPKYEIAEADVPTAQVLNYYVIEKWEFDKRTNRTKTRIVAICPILNRIGDYGEETRYPMFWVKFDQLRPFMAQQYVFLSDDNNLARYSLDDYFTLGMYEGDIVKTKNLRNLSMMQMFPDPDDLRAAQDSIDQRLRNFGGNMWVPTREEYLAALEAEEQAALAAEEGEQIPDRTVGEGAAADIQPANARQTRNVRAKAKTTKTRKASKPKYSSGSSSAGAERSVRRRKR